MKTAHKAVTSGIKTVIACVSTTALHACFVTTTYWSLDTVQGLLAANEELAGEVTRLYGEQEVWEGEQQQYQEREARLADSVRMLSADNARLCLEKEEVEREQGRTSQVLGRTVLWCAVYWTAGAAHETDGGERQAGGGAGLHPGNTLKQFYFVPHFCSLFIFLYVGV